MNSNFAIDSQQFNHTDACNNTKYREQTFLDAQLRFAKSQRRKKTEYRKKLYKKHWQADSGGSNDRS